MRVLIVESRSELGCLWQAHLERLGMHVTLTGGQTEAIAHLMQAETDIVILDLVLEEGSPLAISDFASFRHPNARIIFVTNTTFFSDGSIFAHAQNACALVQCDAPPDDLAAMIEHYAVASSA